MTLHKLKTGDMVLSPARERLKDLLEQRGACEKRAQALRVAQGRLVDPSREAAAAAADLTAFDAQNAEALSVWARNGIKKTDRPVVDTDKRQALIAAKQISAENAVAAQAAIAKIGSEIHAEDLAAKTFEMPITAAIAEIIAETVDPLLGDLQETVRVGIQKTSLIKRALQTVVDLAHSAGSIEQMKSTFDLAQLLAERIDSARVPAVETFATDLATWTTFAARLRTDPAAELE
jgi:hypothetical protein